MDEKNIERIFIALLLVAGIFYMSLALNTDMLGEDEAVYYGLSKDISDGNYPAYAGYYPAPQMLTPLLSLVAAPLLMIFGKSLMILKATSAFFFLLTLLTVYLIGKRMNIWLGMFSSVLMFSFSMLSHLSMLAYLDGPAVFFSALIFYMILKMKNITSSIILGLIIGIAFLMKSSFVIFPGLLIIYTLYFKKEIKLAAIALASFFAMLIPFSIRNIILFDYPFVEGFNLLFTSPTITPAWLVAAFKTISTVTLNLQFYIGTTGWIALLLMLFSLPYIVSKNKDNEKEHDLLIFLCMSILTILIVFNITHITEIHILEARHLMIIFPQIALVAGYFLWKLKEFNKFILPLILIILLLSVSVGMNSAMNTSNSQRYTNLYKDSLFWIKENTEKDDIVFTTYIGSLYYYGERDAIWIIEEFPELMTTTDSNYIHKTLKDEHNVSYILIWKNLIAENYIIPNANLLGIYTYNFVNIISNDTERFELVYSNQETLIFKIL